MWITISISAFFDSATESFYVSHHISTTKAALNAFHECNGWTQSDVISGKEKFITKKTKNANVLSF